MIEERKEKSWIVDAAGSVRKGFSLGFEFSSVAADPNGSIWVGYRDQALGWKVPSGSVGPNKPPERMVFLPGLAHWSSEGKLLWTLPDDGDNVNKLFHCYVLNSGRAGMIAVLDGDKSMFRVCDSGVMEAFALPIIAPLGVAFNGEIPMFLGKYEAKGRGSWRSGFDVIKIASIQNGEIRVEDVSRLIMPNGDPLPCQPLGVSSRGSSIMMNFGDPGTVFRLTLR